MVDVVQSRNTVALDQHGLVFVTHTRGDSHKKLEFKI
jgi:hypothetical protein